MSSWDLFHDVVEFSQDDSTFVGDDRGEILGNPSMSKVDLHSVSENERFDYSGLLDRVCNDRELLAELVLLQLDQFPKQMKHLIDAIERSAFEEIKQIAHSIKGSALNMGLNRIGKIAEQLESLDCEKQSNRVQLLQDEWDHTRDILERYALLS